MERILKDDEKIRRAEEIYYRRNNLASPYESKTEIKSKNQIKDKLLLNLLIMINLAIIVFCVQNKDYIFTKEFLGKINDYGIATKQKVLEIFNKELNKYDINQQESNENNELIENSIDNMENSNEGQIAEKSNISEISSISEMELDVQNLKAAYNFIKPIEGVISSGFGSRESVYQNVTGYHTGLDIAAEKGTIIRNSMQGIVDLVSSEGDYGNHIKIRCNNVTTVYAHCSEIFVKKGQIISQGQAIASVGSTGNSTGPHLHFEIRVDDRYVDPLKIISF